MLLLLHALWTPITLLLFVLVVRPSSNPLALVAEALHVATSTRGGKLVLWIAAATIGANFLECLIEPWLAGALGYDLTAWVRSVEGATVERVQGTLPAALVPVAVWFYLAGYVAGLLTPATVWTVETRFAAAAALVAGYVANYAIGLPFYFFAPVQEVAWSGLSDAKPLLDAAFPGLSGETRVGSGLDNCLPSLHVSLTWTAFFIALARGESAMRWFTGVVAVLTAYAVMALGIHWALDVGTGVVLGAACAGIGLLWARRRERVSASS
ncbi:MAG: phosphatase PAP2 family protein [Planctomycetota bacterium]